MCRCPWTTAADTASDAWDASFETARARRGSARGGPFEARGRGGHPHHLRARFARSDRAAGADPVLRFLALVQAVGPCAPIAS